eukprot:TRINITY_DN807_c0_g1::TRINITY_DN807_c0_g1_i1::g.25283::m.25283 TRINITY_DN807_c0_g1::TRINITY_DN807_c0_g1_i1::g.25283  ORF type:complete len:395 (+),score=100.76,sp/P54644/KRAC_DICDI/51.80/2e-122,Pkinase/PF00069.20/1.7e-73,Pkinase_Tyr/PF07714.12/9.7e-31,Pkinase_C/PF00433.19/5.7e-11,Kinase-like/PF14531.1/5.2e+02,Kinase-like/PF14531.1/0.00044,APH/PF01636.18/0.042,Kdo/PF06293.9/0.11 TRINITY_DN807_c0_g1_i1:85-1185(+)
MIKKLFGRNGEEKKSAGEASSPTNESKEPHVTMDDFELIKVIGKGSYGKVMLVKKKDTGRLYAMKVLKKANILQKKQVEHTKTERHVLGTIKHPFIVTLHYAFQTPDKLHFVLDYCSGGELFFHLSRLGRFDEELTRFYASELLLAIGHLHSMGIIYRDLKPENVLLDEEGHLRLADFGLSKEGITESTEGAHSFCGSPEYLAPEVLEEKGHGKAVDWWSLGSLIYEMLTGLPAFYSHDRQKLFRNILSAQLTIPAFLSEDASDLLKKLLQRDPAQRLGSKSDAEDLKKHPFFKKVDFNAIMERKLSPPFHPHKIANKADTSNFDPEFTSMPLQTPEQNTRLHDLDQSNFEGFSYVSASVLNDGGK